MALQKDSLYYSHLSIQEPFEKPGLSMMHSHNSYELLFFEKGEADYVIEDREYRLHKNDLIIIRPLKYHYIKINSNSEYSRCNILFDPSFLENHQSIVIPDSLHIVNCPKDGILYDIFTRMNYYHSSLSSECFEKLFPCLLTELLYNINLLLDEPNNISFKTSPFLTQALDYINENLFTIKSIREVSKHFFVSEQYLFKQFQSQLKITPKKYVNTKRLLHAQKMLRQGKKPIQIYSECGFESYVGFYKQYVKNFGYPPSKEKGLEFI